MKATLECLIYCLYLLSAGITGMYYHAWLFIYTLPMKFKYLPDTSLSVYLSIDSVLLCGKCWPFISCFCLLSARDYSCLDSTKSLSPVGEMHLAKY